MLLEVNVLPSLSSSSELDKRIKTSLMSDTFNLIGVTPYRRKQFEKEVEQRHWEKFTGLPKSLFTTVGHSDQQYSSNPSEEQKPSTYLG